ncbi:aminotransferase class I/II-fold pyridoxal phosphate-dependent enzyme [Peptoniphilus sp. KCTC 25270]|uniref:aminotransferase class I/II-fold pyridoxal phosphate-dependent enzyme n=1 Tax=Peptoniphilus sp. KCTC 25270 TaxID=2897414 RepID=UPI001E30F36D|nr:aminotransferase class I/II-fold pyridoxal phosphate-dependent enzyme [Peptoniphilus sp. KCTC 25270]
MEKVLQNRLKNLIEKDFVRFHYPGHKGRKGGFDPALSFLLDYTETYGTDNLLHPEEILCQSQKLAAESFQTLDTFYGVGGSTMAIYAGIFALAQEGEEILIQRNCHKSVYQGALLRKSRVHTLSPEYDEEGDVLLGISTEKLEKFLQENPKISLLVLTNPSYYGVILPLKEQIDLAHKYGVGVLVDEAHGAHLPLSHRREDSALAHGADIVVHSAHKSLGALTQTALLHRNSERISRERVLEMISLFTSTSPSYLFMTSIEASIGKAVEWKKKDWENLEKQIEDFKNKAQELGYEFYKAPKSPYVGGLDFLKIFFRYPGYSGEELSDIFYEKGINFEMSDGSYLLGVLSSFTTEEDLNRCLRVMSEIPKREGKYPKSAYIPLENKKEKEMYEAKEWEGEWVPISESLHRISKHFVFQYPPGVPLLLPGERISEKHIEIFEKNRGIYGIERGRVKVL